MERENLYVESARMPEPQFILDAGGETAAVLSGSLHRCIAEIEPGQILQVISPESSSTIDVPEWCRLTGHELLQVQSHRSETLFWIRKKRRTVVKLMNNSIANAEGL